MCTASRQAHKTKRCTTVYLLCSMGSAEKYFLRICSWTDRICVTAEWCVLRRKKKKGKKKAAATLVKFIREWDTAAAAHKNRTTRDHNFETTMSQNRGSDLFLNNFTFESKQGIWPFFKKKKKHSPTLTESPVCESVHQIRHCFPATIHWESALQGKL